MIPRKLYMRMTDMAEEAANNPGDASLDHALVNFQDEIGWPFKASQEQLSDWNSKNWEPKMETRTPIADKMIREAARKPVDRVVENEMEVNPFAGSGAGKNQRARMLQWMELKTKEAEIRKQAEELKAEADEIAEELDIVGILQRMDEQIAYFDEVMRKMTVKSQSYVTAKGLMERLVARMMKDFADQFDEIKRVLDEVMEEEKKATIKVFPTHRKYSKADVKKRGVGEGVGDAIRGVWNKLKQMVQRIWKRADQIDANLAKLDAAVSGQTERRRPRRRVNEGLRTEDPTNAEEALDDFMVSTEYDSLPQGRDALTRDEFGAVFEHGQLWIVHNPSGAQWSVVDTNYGFDFEMVSEGDLWERRRRRVHELRGTSGTRGAGAYVDGEELYNYATTLDWYIEQADELRQANATDPWSTDALYSEMVAVMKDVLDAMLDDPRVDAGDVDDDAMSDAAQMAIRYDVMERRRPRRRRVTEQDAFGAIPDPGADPMNRSNDNELTMNFVFNEAWLANGYYEAVRNKLAGLVVSWPEISGLAGEREWTVRVSGIIDERRQKLLKSMAGEYEGDYDSEGLPWGM